MNASIGLRTNDNTVGPNGVNTPNKKGKEAINLVKSFNFNTPLTFFNHRFKHTWRGFDSSNKQYQIDQWITNSNQFVKDAKVTDLEVPSDHSAILINVFFKRKRPKPKNTITTVDWNLFLGDEIKDKFNADVKGSLKNHVFYERIKKCELWII